MTDIVARLRSLNDGNRWPMMDEAADEIERLRASALAFLDCQTDENAEALRRALERKP
jgi:hypothetical protein